jgi:hypothetical protein
VKINNGDLLIPTSEGAKKVWGKGVVMNAMQLNFPPAHLVYWFGHDRQIVIEEELIFGNFEVASRDEGQQ